MNAPKWTEQELLAVALLLAVVISWFLTIVLIRLAPRLGLLDVPSARKVHAEPIPRGGGLAFIVATLAALGWLKLWPETYWYKLGALIGPDPSALHSLLEPSWALATVLAAVGLVDDLRPLPWQWRLGAQALVAGTAVAFALPPLPGWGQVVAVVWLVALTNAFNMLDNMDTLAGGAAFIAAGCLTWALGYPSGVPYVLLVMSLIGFLHFNRPPARIFMGDTGSMFLGFVIGFAALRVAVQPDGPPWSPLVALCVCAVPLYDQASVVLLRLCQGRSPFHADKQHLSHRLVARGLSSKAAVGLIHLLALVSGAAGLLLYAVSSWVPAALIAGLVGAGWLGLAAYEFAVVGWPPPGADTPGSPAPPAPPGEAPRPDDARPR